MKKIFLLLVIIFSFVLGSSALPDFSSPIHINKAMAQVDEGVPSEGLDEGGFMFDLSVITHEDITGGSRQHWIREGINYIFERIIGVMAATIGGLSVLVMSYGGFRILASRGDDNEVTKGKAYIKYSIMGLVFALGAYLLVSAVQILIRSIYG
jgi:hypothetical protein